MVARNLKKKFREDVVAYVNDTVGAGNLYRMRDYFNETTILLFLNSRVKENGFYLDFVNLNTKEKIAYQLCYINMKNSEEDLCLAKKNIIMILENWFCYNSVRLS